MSKHEYQTARTEKSDREYFRSYREAVKRAKEFNAETHAPVYIDIIFNADEHDAELTTDFSYVVENGKVRKSYSGV